MRYKIFYLVAICCFSTLVSNAQWSLTGNSGTTPGTNYIGTSDGQALLIKTNGMERIRITSSGNIGINNSNPQQTLDIVGGVNIDGSGSDFKFVTGALGFSTESRDEELYWGDINGAYSNQLMFRTNPANNYFLFGSASANAKLGINIQPSEALTVLGNVRFSGALMPNNTAGTSGQVLTSAGAGNPPTWTTLSGSGWSLTGNASTNPSTDFIGTTDNNPLIIKVNNVIAGKVAPDGFVSLGYEANRVNSNATNTAIGHQAFYNITGGGTDWSTAVGYQAGYSVTSGWNSTFIGYKAGYKNTTGRNSTAIGTMALGGENGDVTGFNNTAVGALALLNITSGANNVAIGNFAGRYSSGTNRASIIDSNCVFIGMNATRDASIPITTSLKNAIAIGYNAMVASSNSMVLGGTGSDAVNVGIGTTAPDRKMEIRGNDAILRFRPTNNNNFVGVEWTSDYGVTVASSMVNSTSGELRNYAYSGTFPTWYSNGGEQMRLTTSGNLGIGTTTPSANAKLDVNGNIFSSGKIAVGTTDTSKMSGYSLVVNGEAIFNKARVKLYANWPDFVFEEKYGLLPIAQLEEYIKTNKHLPNIPAAAKVREKGIDLGSNQALLLQKIEELTLYIIEQNKKIESLERDMIKVKHDQPINK